MAKPTNGELDIARMNEQMCEGAINMVRQSNYGYVVYVALSVVNIVAAFLTLLGNILFMVALRKESSLHSPTKLLFRSLALADLCVGLFVQPRFVLFLIGVAMENPAFCLNMNSLATYTATVFPKLSLSSLTLLSVDGCLALHLGLRYRCIVTIKRTTAAVFLAWLFIVAFLVVSYLWKDIFVGTVELLSIMTSTFCHTKVFFALRQHRRQVQGLIQSQQQQVNGNVSSNVRQLSKTMSAVLLAQLTMIVSSIPIVTSYHVFGLKTMSLLVIAVLAMNLRLLNSTLNPVIYCWRIKQVRQAMKETIRQILCLSN